MDLQETVITDIARIYTTYLKKGDTYQTPDRGTYGIALCERGRITYCQDGKELALEPNHVVILPKGQSYSLRCDKDGDFPVINFLTLHPLCDEITILEISDARFLLQCYGELKQLLLGKENRAKCMSVFYDLLHHVSRRNNWGILQAAVDSIYSSYHLPDLSISDLAKACQISEAYFRRLFKAQFGVSPKQFIIDLRIQKAKILLSEGYLKIWAVSEACGFPDPYSFSRIFRQRTDMTPQEYRARNRILLV